MLRSTMNPWIRASDLVIRSGDLPPRHKSAATSGFVSSQKDALTQTDYVMQTSSTLTGYAITTARASLCGAHEERP